MLTIAEKVLKVISEHYGKKVTEKTNFVEDLGADSLDIIETVMELESKLDLDIPDEEMENMITVQNVIDYAERNYKK